VTDLRFSAALSGSPPGNFSFPDLHLPLLRRLVEFGLFFFVHFDGLHRVPRSLRLSSFLKLPPWKEVHHATMDAPPLHQETRGRVCGEGRILIIFSLSRDGSLFQPERRGRLPLLRERIVNSSSLLLQTIGPTGFSPVRSIPSFPSPAPPVPFLSIEVIALAANLFLCAVKETPQLQRRPFLFFLDFRSFSKRYISPLLFF